MVFLKDKRNFHALIIGCGRLGSSIANSLSDESKDVTVMDIDKNSFRKLSSTFGGLFIVGNAMDIDSLKEVRIDEDTVVIIVTNKDNTNIMIAELIRTYFDAREIIARLYDPERSSVYEEFGISTICPVNLMKDEIYNILGVSEND